MSSALGLSTGNKKTLKIPKEVPSNIVSINSLNSISSTILNHMLAKATCHLGILAISLRRARFKNELVS